MAKPVEMPRMGYDMTEGKISRWIKQEGDQVQTGEMLAEIETDKVNIEIESFASGVLKKILHQEGDTVPVGEVIAVIGAPDEEIDLAALGVGGETAAQAEQPAAPSAPAAEAPAATTPSEPSTAEAPAAQAPAPTPAQAAPAPTPAQAAPATQPEGRLALDTGGPSQRLTAPSTDRLKASPVARRLAESHSVDLAQITGTGPGGRIVKDDVENFIRQQPARPAEAPAAPAAPAPAPAPAPAVAVAAGAQEVPLTRMRQTIARVTSQSKQQAPHFYLTAEVEMDAALALRQQLNAALESEGAKLSVNDLVTKAVAKALVKHRYMNATFAGDKIVVHPTVDVGIAVSLEQGLISPVIRNADVKSISAISNETRDLAGRARAGTIKPEEYSGGTFTISNLGMYDIEEFIAIIVPPQAGILAVGAAIKRPVVRDDEVAIASIMKITLSADHRVVDGAQAAVFLNEIRRLLESPMLLLA
jgi:pyruvate dehydrogenase E2 component (dihydrolipoamide acetyltransferase)